MAIPLVNALLESRFWALVVKEIHQILRNKQLLFLLIFPPTFQLLVFGLALSPDLQQLPLGVVDYAQTLRSRELVSALTANDLFQVRAYVWDQQTLARQVERGQITAGLVIPPDFNRKLSQGQTAEVQVLIDGVDANTAGIASGYIGQIVNQYNRQQSFPPQPPRIQPQVTFLYNPGLISSWFFATGVIGLVMTLTGSLVSTATVIREKDTGTLEQLLMTPAAAWEILVAKVVPLFLLLMGEVGLALAIARMAFRLPFRGSLLLFFSLSGLYIFVGIGIGIMLATLSRNQRQAQLTSFFINLPLIQLSGAIAPIESMPPVIQSLSQLNPLRHYIAMIRGIVLKGVGLDVLWPQVLALGGFAVALLWISIHQFRRQLS